MKDLPEMTRVEKAFQEAFASIDAGLVKKEALDAYILKLEKEIEESNAELNDVLNQTD